MNAQKIEDVNRLVKIGTVIYKPNYAVDFWQVTKISDAGDHWRGTENKILTVIPIHDTTHGWYDLPLLEYGEFEKYVQTTLCSCRHDKNEHSLPHFDGRHFVLMQYNHEIIHTYDIAEGDMFEIYAPDQKAAIACFLFTGKTSTQEWCNHCKEITAQVRMNDGENYDTKCKDCGTLNFHIQGFNANLM